MRKALRFFAVAVFGVAVVSSGLVPVYGQEREKFVISARAGGINAVTGRVSMHPRGGSEWRQLSIKDDLQTGDVVKTGLDGRVEMLLNPGSYFRVGEDSEFQMADNSLEKLEIRLLRGTAIVEATGAEDTELLINISTPHTRMAIVRRGLYRVNVVPGDTTELIVRKGRVLLADFQTKVKGGTKVIFSGSTFSMAKLDKASKKKIDNLEAWSKGRAETVAQANRKIQSRDLNSFLAGYGDIWTRHSFSSGFWLFNARAGCYTFLPFYFGWGSPYGASYTSLLPYYPGGTTLYGGQPGYGGSVVNYPSTGGSGTRGSAASSGNPSPTFTAPISSPAPSSPPMTRDVPAAAERKIERLNDRMP